MPQGRCRRAHAGSRIAVAVIVLALGTACSEPSAPDLPGSATTAGTANAGTAAPSASAEAPASPTPAAAEDLLRDAAVLPDACSVISTTQAMETLDPEALTDGNRPQFADLAQRADEHLQEGADLVEDYADLAGSREAKRFLREFADTFRAVGDGWRITAEAARDDTVSIERVRDLNTAAAFLSLSARSQPESLKPSSFRDLYEATPECPPLRE
jgi:hypothetical protein